MKKEPGFTALAAVMLAAVMVVGWGGAIALCDDADPSSWKSAISPVGNVEADYRVNEQFEYYTDIEGVMHLEHEVWMPQNDKEFILSGLDFSRFSIEVAYLVWSDGGLVESADDLRDYWPNNGGDTYYVVIPAYSEDPREDVTFSYFLEGYVDGERPASMSVDLILHRGDDQGPAPNPDGFDKVYEVNMSVGDQMMPLLGFEAPLLAGFKGTVGTTMPDVPLGNNSSYCIFRPTMPGTYYAYQLNNVGESEIYIVTVTGESGSESLSISSDIGSDPIIESSTYEYQVNVNVAGCEISATAPQGFVDVDGGIVSIGFDSPGQYAVTITVSKDGYESVSETYTVTVVERLEFLSLPSAGQFVEVI